jgi:peptidoglycan/xylan/chitin deacetylase (PgdA/CDA1 family)
MAVVAGALSAVVVVSAAFSPPRSHARAAARRHDRAVPILMYHVVANPVPGAPYPELYVPRGEFAGQVAWLAGHDYKAVTLGRVFDYWRGGAPLPRRPIVFSFDDGYRSQYANALPILRRERWPGVLNLEVRNIREPWGLSPRAVRALLAAGWELDSHSITHPDLTTLDSARLWQEVAGSREILRRLFRVPVAFFCYPSGRYDGRVVAAVRAAGYLGATTTRYGLAAPGEPFTLRRIRVDGTDVVLRFATKLNALARKAPTP